MLHWAIALFTLATIVLTTAYGQLLALGWGTNSLEVRIMYVLNLVLPVATAALHGVNSLLKPFFNWAACLVASHSVKREIFRYRTQVGEYAPQSLGRSAAVTGSPPRAVMMAALQLIWDDLRKVAPVSCCRREGRGTPPRAGGMKCVR